MKIRHRRIRQIERRFSVVDRKEKIFENKIIA